MDIEQAIQKYQPSEATTKLVREAQLLLIAGIVSAGKDTAVGELLKDGQFQSIISHTTRAPRANHGIMEQDGVDYHFIDEVKARDMIEKKQFVEVKYVHGNIYGTSAEELRRIHEAGKIATTDIDIEGVKEYLHLNSSLKAIFLLPPSVDTWLARLQRRYGSIDINDADLRRRLETARQEIAAVQADPRFVIIVNDDLATTIERIRKVVNDERDHTSDFAQAITEHLLEYIDQVV